MYILIVFSCCTYILRGKLLSCSVLQMIIGEKQALGQSVDDELASLQLTSSSRTHSRATATAASRAASRSASRAGSARVAAGSRPVTSSPPPNAAAAVSPRTQPTAAADTTGYELSHHLAVSPKAGSDTRH